MPNFDNWLNKAWHNNFSAKPDFIIGRDSESVTLKRGGATLSAQTVRIVPAPAGGDETLTEAGNTGSESDVILIGGASFDVEAGDRFAYSGVVYTVVSVDKTMPGKVSAYAQGVQ